MRNDFNLNVNRGADDVIIKGYVDDDNQVIITEPDIGSGGGGGGSAGILKLTFTEDPENEGTYICDHTWQEIYDAINAGRYVTFIETDNFDEPTYTQTGISVVIITKAGHAEINDVEGYQSFYYLNTDFGFDIRADSANGYPSYTE